jgi:hypothetical protein
MDIFNKARVQASDIYTRVYEYTSDKFAQAGKVFTLASAYGQILTVLSQLSNMILYFIEDSITEMSMDTASRTSSIQGLARLAGHNATRAVASTGEIKISVQSIPEMNGNQIIIPNFTKIKCMNNNKVYTLNMINDQTRIDVITKVPQYIQVIQGEIYSQTFTGDGTPLQSHEVTTKGSILVDNFFVKVYVNGEKWKVYDSLYDIPRDAKGCLIKTGITGGIDLYFGNSNFGMIPAIGDEIRVEYLQTGGEDGNLREGEDVQFQWIETGYSLDAQEIDLNTALKVEMSKLITFGSNPEPTAMTRLLAPRTSRSFVFANPDNYIVFLEKFNYFSSVDAFTTFDDAYLDDDNIIYLFLIPDITKRLQNNENYFTVPVQYFSLSQQEKDKVLDTINDSGSKIVTTVVKILEPDISRYVLNISLVVFEGYSQDGIKSNIISVLSDYFLANRRRDLIPQSDIVKLVENVDGVDSVTVSFLCEDNEVSKKANPNAPLIGLDDMGDIIMSKNQLCIIRGGWTDRNGISYNDGIFSDKPGSVNITVKRTSKLDVNSQLFQSNMNKIMNK